MTDPSSRLNRQPADFWRLVQQMCDETATVADRDRLESYLLESREARSLLLGYLRTNAELQWIYRGASVAGTSSALPWLPLKALSTTSRSRAFPALKKLTGWMSGSEFIVGSLLLLAVAAAFWGLATFSLRVWRAARDEGAQMIAAGTSKSDGYVAELIDDDNCKWAALAGAKRQTPKLHTRFVAGQTLDLEAGVAKIEFLDGAVLKLDGPVQFTLRDTKQVFLERGRLAARVPLQAVGFTIATPHATVVDLGTEFSVEVNPKDATNVHVLRGMVEVVQSTAGRTPSSSAKPVRLIAGQTVRVDGHGPSTIAAASKPGGREHVQQIQGGTFLNLVDIVAGGDGRGQRRDRGIDPATGQIMFPPEKDYTLFGFFAGDGKYHRVDDRPFLDGVAVPDPAKGPVQLDSAGHTHTFASFSNTDGQTFGSVWAGGKVPVPPTGGHDPFCTSWDGKVDYAIAPHGLIALAPNKILTFDLAAMRRAYSDRSLIAFRAVVGLTKPPYRTDNPGLACTWVFVDGKLRHSRQAINSSDGPEAVEIPLTPSNRFLTLVATDAENGLSADWVLFGDPRIETTVDDTKPLRDAVSPSR